MIQVLSVTDGKADCLVKGPVHGQQIRLLHGGTGSYVDVLGTDTSVTMDREVKALTANPEHRSSHATLKHLARGYLYWPAPPKARPWNPPFVAASAKGAVSAVPNPTSTR